MVIQKNGELHGVADNFHMRINSEGMLRITGTGSGLSIRSDDAQKDYDRIVDAFAKGETFIDLDAEPKKRGRKPKKAEETTAEETTEASEPTTE